jgi:hypothetical protein
MDSHTPSKEATMRKKLWFALLAVAVLGVAAGAHVVSGLNAQDAPKQDAEAKKDDLFENLKKALEAKKDIAPAPPVAKPNLLAIPPMIDDKKGVAPIVPPPLPPMKDDKPGIIPPPSSFDPLPAPKAADVPAKAPTQSLPFPQKEDKPTIPPPTDLKPLTLPESTIAPPSDVKPVSAPPIAPQVKDPPKPDLPPVDKKGPGRVELPPKIGPINKDPQPFRDDKPQAPPTVQIAPNPIGDQVAKMKDCPWTLHVEIVDGKTVMTCTVHKKHQFKIVCQSVDLQTGKTMLKATGKVQITGDMMTGMCENLTIPLMDDRLVMEGAASVTIQKVVATVSNHDDMTLFELKGSSLDLRINEFVVARPIQQTSFQPDRDRVQPIQASNAKPVVNDGGWSPYGRLMPAKISLANESAWSLVGADGKVIADVVARDGGTLSQYEGQRIMVRGTNEQISGRTFLRVTHIALP